MICKGCKRDDELRFGFCFDCASAGEERAARRTVVQHLIAMTRNVSRRRFYNAKCDISWAYQRLTKTGDYAPNGYFEREYFSLAQRSY